MSVITLTPADLRKPGFYAHGYIERWGGELGLSDEQPLPLIEWIDRREARIWEVYFMLRAAQPAESALLVSARMARNALSRAITRAEGQTRHPELLEIPRRVLHHTDAWIADPEPYSDTVYNIARELANLDTRPKNSTVTEWGSLYCTEYLSMGVLLRSAGLFGRAASHSHWAQGDYVVQRERAQQISDVRAALLVTP